MPSALKRYFTEHPWKEACIWLCLLGIFFFSTYGFANSQTAAKENVPSFVFFWEHAIPFLPWTILPYWSIDAFYGLSLFLCRSRAELRTLGKRLLCASSLCVIFFLLFPLRFSFERPETSGISAWLFRSLESFDQPYNQAPSLHICLLFILWTYYLRHVPQKWRWLVHGWAALIAVSTLTTFQHHFIDLITGAWAGCFCLFAVPDAGWPGWKAALPHRAASLGKRYATAAAACLAIAAISNGYGWLLAYPAVALGCVAAGYLRLGPGMFAKHPGCDAAPQPTADSKAEQHLLKAGCQPLALKLLLAPYTAGAVLSRKRFQHRSAPCTEVVPGLWVGGYPSRLPAAGCAVLDLCAEFERAPCTRGIWYCSVPMLDLMLPCREEMRRAQDALDRLSEYGPVLVHCALGYTRSVSTAACWMVRHGHAPGIQDALRLIAEKRGRIVIRDEYMPVLHSWTSQAFDAADMPAP